MFIIIVEWVTLFMLICSSAPMALSVHSIISSVCTQINYNKTIRTSVFIKTNLNKRLDGFGYILQMHTEIMHFLSDLS